MGMNIAPSEMGVRRYWVFCTALLRSYGPTLEPETNRNRRFWYRQRPGNDDRYHQCG